MKVALLRPLPLRCLFAAQILLASPFRVPLAARAPEILSLSWAHCCVVPSASDDSCSLRDARPPFFSFWAKANDYGVQLYYDDPRDQKLDGSMTCR